MRRPGRHRHRRPGLHVKDENLAKANYTASARSRWPTRGANTNGSQFFIITKDSSAGLQKNYTVIGHVTKGMDIVQKVVAGGDDGSNQAGGGKPKLPLTFRYRQDHVGGRRRPDARHRPIAHRRDAESDRDAGISRHQPAPTRNALDR